MQSENVLIIENLSLIPEEKEHGIMFLKSRMESRVKFFCRATGNCFRERIIIAENKGYSQNDTLKKVIQDFINGNVDSADRFHDVKNECFAHNKINHVDVQLQEPFKSLFEQLFDMSSWEIQKKELSVNQ
jgi:hypothetical protein